MMNFLEFTVNYLGDILVIIGIITTLLIALIGLKDKEKEALQKLLIFIVSFCVVLLLGKAVFESNYSRLPNVSGLTYSEALSAISDAGINPQFVLASTNDISSESCRVFWQSLKPGDVEEKGELCLLLLDDFYQVDSQKAVEYTVDYSEYSTWRTYLRVSNEYDIQDLKIEICANSFIENTTLEKYSLLSTNFFLLNQADAPSNLESFARTLAGIVSPVFESIENSTTEWETVSTSGKTRFGKLVPCSDSSQSLSLQYVTTLDGEEWIILIPVNLTPGDYDYIFSLVDEVGMCFEWSIPVTIRNPS